MKCIIDENVSYSLVETLRKKGWTVIAISEREHSGIGDDEIYRMATEEKAVLITRDHHFTNPVRFPTDGLEGVIYLRRGDLTSQEEVRIISDFLAECDLSAIGGKLVTLYKDSAKVR